MTTASSGSTLSASATAEQTPSAIGASIMTPREITSELDRHIVGQASAKRAVAIALRNRWRRMNLGDDLRAEVGRGEGLDLEHSGGDLDAGVEGGQVAVPLVGLGHDQLRRPHALEQEVEPRRLHHLARP